jgi:hypothetical protein
MSEIYRIEDLAADEFAELLSEHGANLTDEQADALKQFIDDFGDLDRALAAFDMLTQLHKAA